MTDKIWQIKKLGTKSSKDHKKVSGDIKRKSRKVIKKRKTKVKRRKNFFLSLLLIILFWLLLAGLILFTDPSTKGLIVLFFVIFFASTTFMFSFLFINSRRGSITGIALTLFLVLRYFGVGNGVNLILLISLAITTEVFFRNSS